MRFEIGRYYKHSGGNMMHVVTAAKTYIHGWCLIAEDRDGSLRPVGSDETSAVNWSEIDRVEWYSGRSEPAYKQNTNKVDEQVIKKIS